MFNGGLYEIDNREYSFIPGPRLEHMELIRDYENIPDSKKTEIIPGVTLLSGMDTKSLIDKVEQILYN